MIAVNTPVWIFVQNFKKFESIMKNRQLWSHGGHLGLIKKTKVEKNHSVHPYITGPRPHLFLALFTIYSIKGNSQFKDMWNIRWNISCSLSESVTFTTKYIATLTHDVGFFSTTHHYVTLGHFFDRVINL